jgi:D-glycero-alpha-D-manno-heptose-7-phosphate kinase
MIEVSVPIRICDLGGWTDTWFGAPGRVVNVAVTPGVRVSMREIGGDPRVLVQMARSGEPYTIVPQTSRVARHPVVEAAIDACPPPDDRAVEICVDSAVPAGCGTGTSAAVAVALLGGLAALRSEPWSATDVASTAHRLEVQVLRLESGVQDQLSSAFGGINYLEIDAYPDANVQALPAWDDMGDRLTLVYLGRAHDSSGLHREVIQHIAGQHSSAFDELRDAARAARDAVGDQDLEAFGVAMIRNTDAQRSLHPDLVGADARRVIAVAAEHGAVGWKVNGAGGDGGSLTLLSASPEAKHALEARIERTDPRYQIFPVEISSVGLDVKGCL